MVLPYSAMQDIDLVSWSCPFAVALAVVPLFSFLSQRLPTLSVLAECTI